MKYILKGWIEETAPLKKLLDKSKIWKKMKNHEKVIFLAKLTGMYDR